MTRRTFTTEEMPELVTGKAAVCPRCGGNHPELVFAKITDPVAEDDGKVWHYWAQCPVTHKRFEMRSVDGVFEL